MQGYMVMSPVKKNNRPGNLMKVLRKLKFRKFKEFIYNLLEARGYKNKVVQFNGSNTDAKSK